MISASYDSRLDSIASQPPDNPEEMEGFFLVSPDLLVITTLDGLVVQVNDSWETILGYTRDELQDRSLLEYLHPDDRTDALDALQKLRSSHQVLTLSNRCRTKSGSWRHVEWRAQSRGERIYAAARDITQRKLFEGAREKQARLLAYRNDFEEMLTSISTRFISLPATDIDEGINDVLGQVGEFESVDRCYVFLFDRKQQMSNSHEWCAAEIEPQIEMLQDLPADIFPWWMGKLERLEEVHFPLVSELPPDAQAEREILEEQAIQSVLVVPMHVDSRVIGFLGFDSVARPRTWERESIRLIKMVADIISNALMRKKMEEELRSSEARNSGLLTAVPDLIFRISREGRFLDYKASSDELLVLPPEKIIGASLETVLGSSVAADVHASIENALQTGEVQSLDYTMHVHDVLHVFEARFNSSGPDEVIVVSRDISERARLERMKTDFIHRASHELRTPIATMVLMAELIDEDIAPGKKAECWEIMKDELDHQRQLVETLLMAGSIENKRCGYRLRQLDLSDLVRRAVRTLQPLAGKRKQSLSVDDEAASKGPALLVHADETAMMQVLVNLVNNAITFTPEGGAVKVAVKRTQSRICVTVSDNGMGIPAEDLPNLFTRFFRASNAIKEEIQGTGIGLYIVRSVIEEHGGTIQVQSRLGNGSTFEVCLPAA